MTAKSQTPSRNDGTPKPSPPVKTSPTTPPPGINIAGYNIQDSRNSRFIPLCRTLTHQNIDICIAFEAKQHDEAYIRHTQGYDIWCTRTTNRHQGGLAIIQNTRTQRSWTIESIMAHGPNVLSCVLRSGLQKHALIGAYLPPSNLDDLPHLVAALERFPHLKPILIADLNTDLHSLNTPRAQTINATLVSYGLQDLLYHFVQARRYRNLKTWQQSRQGTTLQSRCDYIMSPDRRYFEWLRIKEPRYFTSDHFMLVARLLIRPTPCHRRYLHGRKKFPIRPPIGPITRADWMFQMVKDQCPPPPRAQARKVRPHWLSPETIQAMDTRCNLRRDPNHDRSIARQLTRRVNALINQDRKKRTEEAGKAIQDALSGETQDLQGAYNILKRWYRHHGDRPQKPTREDLRVTTQNFSQLFKAETPSPPGDPIPVHVQPVPVDDTIPTSEEIKATISRLRNNRATGPSRMKAETLKDWRKQAFPEEYAMEGADIPEPDTTQWDILCSLIGHIFQTGEIPSELKWSVLALLPKPDRSHRGIGLQEVAWKLCSAIIDNRLKAAIRLDQILHGFTSERGTGTAIIEAKLQQELAHIRGQPLFQVYIDLRKAYDTLDRDRSLATMEAYGLGPNCARVLRNAREGQQIVARQSGYYGEPFTATRGSPQGDLFSPQEFNINLDCVIRHWKTLTLNDEGAPDPHGLTVAERLTLFYADDGLLSSIHPEWLQRALDLLVGLFRRIGLETNVGKTATMTCYPGRVPNEWSHHAYKRRLTGDGDSSKDRKRQRVECPECQKSLAKSSLKQHLRKQHGIDNLDLEHEDEYNPPPKQEHYRITFLHTQRHHPCPVDGCPHKKVPTPQAMRTHFMFKHPECSLCVINEGAQPLPKCPHCDMHVTYQALNTSHQHSQICKKGAARKQRRTQMKQRRHAQSIVITIQGQDLQQVSKYCYLGRMMSNNNSDWLAAHRNIKKASQKWAMVARPLLRTGVHPRMVGMFYKAIVQAVLLPPPSYRR